MARRARKARGSTESTSAHVASPHIQRKLPFYDPLDEEQLVKIDAQIDWMLENIGFAFRDDPEAIRIWETAVGDGVKIEGDRIFADAQWVRAQCAKAPSQFDQIARNPARSVTIGGNNQVFAPIYGAPFARDLKGGRRYATYEDFQNLLRLSYMHPNLHHTGLVIAEPTDIPVSKRHLDMVYSHMVLSDKPHLGAITEKSRAQDSVDMASLVFGEEFVQNNCVMLNLINANSPMTFDSTMMGSLEIYAANNQASIISPFIVGDMAYFGRDHGLVRDSKYL